MVRSNPDSSAAINGPRRTRASGRSGMLQDAGNFGSLSSTRPTRSRKRPSKLDELVPEPEPAKRAKTSKRTPNPSSEKAAPMATRSSPRQNSKIVTLRISQDRLQLAIAPDQSGDHGSDRSSPVESALPSQIDVYTGALPLQMDRPSQDAQIVPAPVPASSQNTQMVPAPVPASSQDTQMVTAPATASSSERLITPGTSPTGAPKVQTLISQFLLPQKPKHWLPKPSESSQENLQTSPLQEPYPTPGTGRCQDVQDASDKSDSEPEDDDVHDQDWFEPLSTQGIASHTARVASSYTPSEATTENEEATSLPVAASIPVAASTYQDEDLHHLHTISEELLAQRNIGKHKPEPVGQPEVWAEGRQELCETLHYYKGYQSACYATGGYVRAFMFDKVAHNRDYIDSDVIICRAGGGLTRDKESGDMKAGGDQKESFVVECLRNCMLSCSPVVVITGADNPHIPSKPPHQYCVLDYFKPTHIWTEKTGGSDMVRYRFEKLNSKKDSWWRAKDSSEVAAIGSLPPPVESQCEKCRVVSPQVYLNGWMCLQSTCASFWKITISTPGPGNNTYLQVPHEDSLIYDPRFLKQKTSWVNDDRDYPLVSNTAELSAHPIPGEDMSLAFWSGMVCPKCGKCIMRLLWASWRCTNRLCDYVRSPPHTLIPAFTLRDPRWPVTEADTLSRDTCMPIVELHVSFSHGYRINRFNIPGIDGFITHMIANKTILEEAGGPDAMYEELQQTEIGLERRPMPGGMLKGPSYCRHFSVNYGMPYKFIAALDSHSFEEAARPITSTRSRLNWAAKLVLSQGSGKSVQEMDEEWKKTEFNEVLALGYFEDQRINYHDDGEFGLGPTIATLSLGAPGTMHIRMKARRYHGVSSASGGYDELPPIPGCQKYEERLALQPTLEALKKKNMSSYNARRKEIPKQLHLNPRGQAKNAITMQLGHGDIVIMHGADVQRYYEHAVEHEGVLRFALTCRYIDPGSLKAEDQPKYEVGDDRDGYDGSGLL